MVVGPTSFCNGGRGFAANLTGMLGILSSDGRTHSEHPSIRVFLPLTPLHKELYHNILISRGLGSAARAVVIVRLPSEPLYLYLYLYFEG